MNSQCQSYSNYINFFKVFNSSYNKLVYDLVEKIVEEVE